MKLKSVMLLVVVLVVMEIPSQAQMKIEFGVKGGLNLAGLALSTDGKLSGAKYNNLTTFHGGVYGQFRLKKLAVQPEIVFSRQGQVYTTSSYSNLRTDLNYINVPVLIKYYPVGGLHIFAGPQFGFLISAKGDLVHINSSGGITSLGYASFDQDLKSYLNSTDFSIVFGAGIDLPLGLNLGVRYNWGQSNINKYLGGSSESPSFSIAKTQNQVIQISLAKKLFKIGK